MGGFLVDGGSWRFVFFLTVLIVGVLLIRPAAASHNTNTVRVSVSSSGAQSNGDSSADSSVSSDGQVVAFASQATNLVPSDTNGRTDIFARDLQTGVTERVSISSATAQANQGSSDPTISGDGRFVAFESFATNIVFGTTTLQGVFVHDRQNHVTQRVSFSPTGAQITGHDPAISGDGRFVAFSADTAFGVPELLVRDRLLSQTRLVPYFLEQGNVDPAISADGRFIAFAHLSGGDPLFPDRSDVILFDSQTNDFESISIPIAGVSGGGGAVPAVSDNGRFVAFQSSADDLVIGDRNTRSDVFVRDRQTRVTERVSVSSDESEANGFGSSFPDISADGRFVAFYSEATNLVPSDTNSRPDIFVRDRQAGTTERISISSAEAQANGASLSNSISGNGRFVAFSSVASNLVSGDTNSRIDIFLRDRDICPSGNRERGVVSNTVHDLTPFVRAVSCVLADRGL